MKLRKVFPIIAMLLVVFLAGCKKDKDTGVPPTVTSTDPINKATSIAINSNISAIFSVAMNPSTITSSTFTLKQGVTPVLGAVTYTGTTATFTPAANLATYTIYTATITTGAKDESGKSMAKDYIWSFTSGEPLDITRPTVTLTDPINNVTGVALNKVVALTFSVPMDPATIIAGFTLMQGTTPVPGTVTYSGTKATFTPTNPLNPNLTYTVKLTGAKDMAGNTLASNYTLSFTTVVVPDITLPLVNLTDPINNVIGVASNKVVALTFSEAMNPSTINATTFTLMQGTTPVTGTVTYSGTTAMFTPANPLAAGLPYTATITTGAKDLSGNALAANTVWTFTTDASPTVISTDPAIDATDVVLNKTVTATFSVPMDPLTLNATTFTIKQGATSVAGIVSYSGSTATFIHPIAFTANTIYTGTITTEAKNVPGTPLANDYVWTFTTLPMVISTDPNNNGTGVPINTVVVLTFSVPMDPATINTTTLTLWDGTTAIPGTVTYSGNTATFTPTNPLVAGHTYTIKLIGAKDLNGNLFTTPGWTFTTGDASSGPLVVDLKTAGQFGILAGLGISNNGGGASVINDMDVGLYPGVLSSITGFPPAFVVNGAIYGANSPEPAPGMLRQAKDDLIAAYNQAAGATSPTPVLVPASLGGRTLGPGIYKSVSSMLLQNGDLTLDAKGDENAVWIFQIGTDLTTVGGAGGTYGNVLLTNGAQAKNVFWQVGTSAVIGDYTLFKGTVMALTSITMGTGATAVGRMLARTGAVVLTSTNTVINSITKP